MQIHKDIAISGSAGRAVLLDVFLQPNGKPKPVLVFAHGFKGFKDWGFWGLIAQAFAEAGYIFLKFNFSHNGTTPAHPADFGDLEAFGRNNYSRELEDLEAVLNWVEGQSVFPATEANVGRIGLIGHSRGGGVVLVKAVEDPRVGAAATWASVSDLQFSWKGPGIMEHWRRERVLHIPNARTGQQMPLYYQFYEDFQKNPDRWDLQKQLAKISKPCLFVHGTEDLAVPASAATQLREWAGKKGCLQLVKGGDHVFGGSHPFAGDQLPEPALKLVELTRAFFDEQLK